MNDPASYRVATKALGADAHGLRGSVFERNANSLKIRLERTTCNARNLRTNALQMLRATTSLNAIANQLALAANFTNTRHGYFLYCILNERFRAQCYADAKTAHTRRRANLTGGEPRVALIIRSRLQPLKVMPRQLHKNRRNNPETSFRHYKRSLALIKRGAKEIT